MNSTVKDLMKKDPLMISPEDTLAAAAKKMRDGNCGCLPVGTADKAEGVITDRDIVVRALAEGRNPAEEKVRDYMSDIVKSCHQGDSLLDAADLMNQNGVSRVIVMDDNEKVCGILSFGRILRNHDDEEEIAEIVSCAVGHKNRMPGSAGTSSTSFKTH